MDRAETRTSRRKSLNLWMAAFIIVAAGIGAAYAALAPRTTIREGTSAEFRGEIGAQHAVARLQCEDGKWRGILEIEGERRFSLENRGSIGDVVELDINWFEEESSQNAMLQGFARTKITDPGAPLEGTWHGDGTEPSAPFHLSRSVSSMTLHRTAGMWIAGRGRQIDYRAELPCFVNGTALEDAFQRTLLEGVRASAFEEVTWPWNDWQDLRESFAIRSGTNAWEICDEWQLTYRNESIISGLCEGYSYTGGAHGNFGFRQLTMYWNGCAVVPVTLKDFFREDSGWREALAKLCSVDLERQEASSPEIAPSDLDKLRRPNAFAIFADGFRIEFGPYSVGSWAEGAYEVTIPFEQCVPYLRTEGPALSLPISRKGASEPAQPKPFTLRPSHAEEISNDQSCQ